MGKINIYEVTFINKKDKKVESQNKCVGKSLFWVSISDYAFMKPDTRYVKFAASSFDEVCKKAKKYSKDEIKDIDFVEEVEI